MFRSFISIVMKRGKKKRTNKNINKKNSFLSTTGRPRHWTGMNDAIKLFIFLTKIFAIFRNWIFAKYGNEICARILTSCRAVNSKRALTQLSPFDRIMMMKMQQNKKSVDTSTRSCCHVIQNCTVRLLQSMDRANIEPHGEKQYHYENSPSK